MTNHQANQAPRLVIAGSRSGVGKTTLTAGLIAAFRQQGLTIQPFKAGPDYIDPTYHTLAAGQSCRNLDSWLVPATRLQTLFAQRAAQADLSMVEGVMGVFDGFSYEHENGSTAEIAKLIQAPVVLVLDAGKMARSAGAMALGYQQFDADLPLAGFIVNRVGSERHGQGVATAIEQATGLPVFGWLPRQDELNIPERHLGLIPTVEPGQWPTFIEAATKWVKQHLDLEGLLTLARQAVPLTQADKPIDSVSLPPTDQRPIIAVARDEAFNFTYEDNLDLLRQAGADLRFFSPLHNQALPSGAELVILSGGFPELFAEPLSANRAMHQAIREAHQQRKPIYAECGGLMYLTETLTDLAGHTHPMIGLLPGHSVMSRQRLTLGYRVAEAVDDSWLFTAGETVRGHEFHYSTWENRPADLPPAYHVRPRTHQGAARPEGANLGNLWASYVHLHFWNKPELVSRFVTLGGRG